MITKIATRWTRNKPSTIPKVPKAPEVVNSTDHLLNDPTTPDLLVTVSPAEISPAVTVKGYVSGSTIQNTDSWRSANCRATISKTLEYCKSIPDGTVSKWSGTSVLWVLPKAGDGLNAAYDRRSLKFFYATSPAIGGTLYTANSADIVAHELGHAILDSWRPDAWNSPSLEIESFHEAFGDFIAILHAMTYDLMLQKAINETNGDLRKSSVISRLAEQFGKALYALDPEGRSPDFLRCAVNDFRYTDPSSLPESALRDDVLIAECHSFSKIMLGALWDILMVIYEDEKSKNVSPLEALKNARDILSRLVFKAIRNVTLNSKFYESFAKTILWSDVVLFDRKYHDRMQKVFFDRLILTPEVRILSGPCYNNCPSRISRNSRKLMVQPNCISIQSLRHSLTEVLFEMPHEQSFLYDLQGNLYDTCGCDDEKVHADAALSASHLQKHGLVGDGTDTPFKISNGVLIRSHFNCGCLKPRRLP